MPTSAAFRPQFVEPAGDGLAVGWNRFDGGVINGDELAGGPSYVGLDFVYWATTDNNTQYSPSLFISDFGLNAIGLGENDRIDGITVTLDFASDKGGSRPVGIRTIALTEGPPTNIELKEDSQNKAQPSLTYGDQETIVFGGPSDTWGFSGLNRSTLEDPRFGFLMRFFGAAGSPSRRSELRNFELVIDYTVDGLLSGLTVDGLVTGGALTIWDDELDNGANLDTKLAEFEPCGASELYTHADAGNAVVIQHIAPGFKEITRRVTLGSTSQTITLDPEPEDNL